jgi:hypothetical protein
MRGLFVGCRLLPATSSVLGLDMNGIIITIIIIIIIIMTTREVAVTAGAATTTKTTSTIIQFNSILYFNVLTQQLQEPIAESAQEDKYIRSIEINIKMRTKLNQIHIII